jgi:arylsulfatase A-like enzyme
MRYLPRNWLVLVVIVTGVAMASAPVSAQQKPNILFIMGDDIGWMQPSIYHRGLMVGETPNIDRIGNEGAMFVDYVAMQSCTSGRMPSSRACTRCARA